MKKIAILLTLILCFSSCEKEKNKSVVKIEVQPKPEIKFGYKLNDYKVIHDTIKNGESFGQILDRHHVYYPKINQIATSITGIFDVRRVKAGKPYMILASKDSTEQAQIFIYKHDKINATVVDFKDSLITAKRFKKPIKVVEKEVTGIINSSLSETMDGLGLKPNLTWTIADIYAWTLDFYALQKGDSFKLVYEEKFIDDTIFAGYGNVKSAVFKHKGKNLFAFRFIADSIKGIPEFYDQVPLKADFFLFLRIST